MDLNTNIQLKISVRKKFFSIYETYETQRNFFIMYPTVLSL